MKKHKSKKVNNIVIHIVDTKFDAKLLNKELYSKKDVKEFKRIVEGMSHDIWIDRTYVMYKGNRFKDAFIKEAGWNKLVNNIIETDMARVNCTKEMSQEILASLMVIASTYMTTILMKFGFEMQDISLNFKKGHRFSAEYQLDFRTSWEF